MPPKNSRSLRLALFFGAASGAWRGRASEEAAIEDSL